MAEPTRLDDPDRLRGETVHDSAGERIGKVADVFYDEVSGRAEWLAVATGLLGTREVLVPLEGAVLRDGALVVPYTRERVRDSPDVAGDELDEDTERVLRTHYGLTDHATLTRSEEELELGTRTVEAGRVRLRKRVGHQPVHTELVLSHEVVELVRERVDRVVPGHRFDEAEVDVPVHEERPVVRKHVVARERIAIGKEVERETRHVEEELRRERIEVEQTEAPHEP